MLINLYNQLLFMSFIAGGLYLILKLFSMVTQKYFTAAWHYYSYVLISTFFVIPYYALLLKLDLHFISKIDGMVPLSSTGFSLLRPSYPANTAIEKVAALPGENYIAYSYFELLPYILMVGTLMFITIIAVQNYKLNKQIFRVCRLTDDKKVLDILSKCKQEIGISKAIPVYISVYKSTPFLCGIFRPRLVLPDIEFHSDELYYVFLHELKHWKNHDVWLKTLMLFINAVHWFNPLTYLIRYDIDRFGEAFNDESVTHSMNKEERRKYCELILSILKQVTGCNARLSSAFSDKRNIERRIIMIMKNEGSKSKKWVRIFAVAMTFALALAGTVTAFAAGSSVVDKSSRVTVADSDIGPLALLYENEKVFGPDGHFVTTEFSTPSTNSNNINVCFHNKGTSSVTVTLEKKGLLGWSKVDSFTVKAGKNPYKEMDGASKTTYRIKIDTSTGADIEGHLRANQL
ncbi:M56 family metallopeptidase [Desulfoscipio gibsoniae]